MSKSLDRHRGASTKAVVSTTAFFLHSASEIILRCADEVRTTRKLGPKHRMYHALEMKKRNESQVHLLDG